MEYLLLLMLFSFQAEAPQTDTAITATTLEVKVSGIEKEQGHIEVSLFNHKRKWLKKGKAYVSKRVAVNGSEVVVVFDNLPIGKYAMVTYQDINENNKIDKNFWGLPKEPYAMTRPAKSKLRKPYFKEMAFECNEAHQVLETSLKRL